MVYIYSLKYKGVPFYVGSTCNPVARYGSHAHNCTGRMKHFVNRCFSRKEIFTFNILFVTNEKYRLIHECYFMSLYRNSGLNLLNLFYNGDCKLIYYEKAGKEKIKPISIPFYYKHIRHQLDAERLRIKQQIIFMEEITVKKYAELAGISAPAISYRMKNKKRLPGIKSYRFDVKNKCYLLKYDGSPINNVFRTYIRK